MPVTRGAAAGSSAPALPPVLSTNRTSVSTAAGSTALTMSCSARPATATAVSASISTPVRPRVRAVAVISTASSPISSSTVTPDSGIW